MEERYEAALGTDLDQVPRRRMLSINKVITYLRISAPHILKSTVGIGIVPEIGHA